MISAVAGRPSVAARHWDEAAEGLRTWWPAFEHVMAPVTEAMVAAADLRPGDRVLDVATGFGEPALTLARLVGPSGQVVASDVSLAMLAVAAERARAIGLANVEVAEVDAQAPMIAEAGFDALTCRLGLMFVPDVDLALRRLAGLVVPGGTLVAAVWGQAEANPAITLATRTLARFLEPPSIASSEPGIFDLGTPGALGAAFARAGLAGVRVRRVALEFAWACVEDYVAHHRYGPVGRPLADAAHGIQDAAWRAVGEAARRHLHAGSLRLPAQVVVVSAHRAARTRREVDEGGVGDGGLHQGPDRGPGVVAGRGCTNEGERHA